MYQLKYSHHHQKYNILKHSQKNVIFFNALNN